MSKVKRFSQHQPVGVSLNQIFGIQTDLKKLLKLSVIQGQSRRVQVEVKSVQESGTLPLMEECILSVGIGCIKVRPLRSPKMHELFHVSFSAYCVLVERPKQTRESCGTRQKTAFHKQFFQYFFLFSFGVFLSVLHFYGITAPTVGFALVPGKLRVKPLSLQKLLSAN